ncbi:hypothetical protein M422DRAFT_176618 [Sphaerobolus stellatus SS14]|uniref:Altered inheritance of mitochondria protein 6 n=1 Tax=Sphaerobolus stellatus (strain SS14) TaxID=990650 RepID=A0A0C9VA87_SPHS4|nr:hypothetical protein M422DRAFT_176618 [Sphaerobolus stellatus SS14]
MFLGTLSVLGLSVQVARAAAGVNQQIADLEKANSSQLLYPTDFTQNIVPKAIHSHNDYWRDVPLLTALSFGVASVEADVWLVDGELFVGHEMAALTKARTFDSLYVQPLLTIINNQNPKNSFTSNQTTINGVFDTSSGTPLQLLVDVKTDGVQALPFILRALQPLRSAGYLSTFANGTFVQGPLLVIGTGNSPLEQIKALEPRDFFFDAPLTELSVPSNTTWTPTLSPIASTDYGVAVGVCGIGPISQAQKDNITKFVQDADSRGIKSRFWDTPGWPIAAR